MRPSRSSRVAGSVPGPGFCGVSERGVALVGVLMVMLALSLLAASLMLTVNVNTKISALGVRETQALRIAEAGVAEAIARLRHGDIPDNNNPRMVSQIFLAPTAKLPAVGTDTIPMETKQPEGQWLTYSTASSGRHVLTVEYKTDTQRTRIYRYDGTLNPPIQNATGMAIFKITSTGRKGDARRRIVTEITRNPFNLNMKGAMTAGAGVQLAGDAVVCGHNHRVDTPDDTGDDGQAGLGGCNENPALKQWETGLEDLPGIWSAGDIERSVGTRSFGTPNELKHQAGFYGGPWEIMDLTRERFYKWVGARQGTEPNPATGIVHLDNNATAQDQSGTFVYHRASGSGFLYVDGDLTLNSSFTYRGLVYVEGDVRVNGHAWILGALIVRGQVQVRHGGAATVLYSRDAVQQHIPRDEDGIVVLSWREVPN